MTRLHYGDRIVFLGDNLRIILVPANLELICSVVQRRERERTEKMGKVESNKVNPLLRPSFLLCLCPDKSKCYRFPGSASPQSR